MLDRGGCTDGRHGEGRLPLRRRAVRGDAADARLLSLPLLDLPPLLRSRLRNILPGAAAAVPTAGRGGAPTALPFLAMGTASVLQHVREQPFRRAGWCASPRDRTGEYARPYRPRTRAARLLG